MKCPSCGLELPEGSIFCFGCVFGSGGLRAGLLI
ncbi:MAG: zinc-ribbon domain-containing protein [Ruminococcus sp.]|nr:zinc-ribbon domain-containing protein [Ruminococcus sp.]